MAGIRTAWEGHAMTSVDGRPATAGVRAGARPAPDDDGLDLLPVGPEPAGRSRDDDAPINLSGDLRRVLEAAPAFGRALLGYSRFQVDNYAQWAEEELAVVGRDRDDLLARCAQLQAELDEAQRLLGYSPGGREFLRLSTRMGSLLAAAADQADSMRADADAELAAARAEAERALAEAAAEAERALAEAATEARRVVSEATAEAERLAADAERMLAEAARTQTAARAEAEAQQERLRELLRCAQEDADRLRQRAAEDVAALRLQAREDVVRMLGTAREERRRSETAAAAARDRLDRDAATRRAALLAEVAELEQRRLLLSAALERMAEPGGVVPQQREVVAVPAGHGRAPRLRGGRLTLDLRHLGRRQHS
jgi:cell division septum initiation protein DivIVA